jgi:hypothetical protein
MGTGLSKRYLRRQSNGQVNCAVNWGVLVCITGDVEKVTEKVESSSFSFSLRGFAQQLFLYAF